MDRLVSWLLYAAALIVLASGLTTSLIETYKAFAQVALCAAEH